MQLAAKMGGKRHIGEEARGGTNDASNTRETGAKKHARGFD